MICPYFTACGGCSSQNVDYEKQLEYKEQSLKVILKKSRLELPKIKVFSGAPFHYRNRMDFITFPGGIGFRRKGRYDRFIDVAECPISNEKINLLLTEVRDWCNSQELSYYNIQKRDGTLRYVVIRATESGDSSCSFVVNKSSSNWEDCVELIKEYSSKSTARNVIVAYSDNASDNSTSQDILVLKGKSTLTEKFEDYTLSFDSQGFFQNNSKLAWDMITYVGSIVNPTEKAHLLDLYGGVGTFGIYLSKKFQTTKIVEAWEPSIQIAHENIKQNGANCTAHAMDASKLGSLGLKEPLYVITDPPRSGMDKKTRERLLYLRPKVIIYISCNPRELAKELFHLGKRYNLKSLALFDLFPQTPHIETIAELHLK